MRRIAIIAWLILAGFAAIAAVALLNLSSIANSKKKTQLARAKSRWTQTIVAKNLTVADDPSCSTGGLVKTAGRRLLVPGSVPWCYARILTARDTVFDELKDSFISTLGAAQFMNVLLPAPDFWARGEGRGDLKGRIDFAGALPLSSQITRSHYFGNGAQVRS